MSELKSEMNIQWSHLEGLWSCLKVGVAEWANNCSPQNILHRHDSKENDDQPERNKWVKISSYDSHQKADCRGAQQGEESISGLPISLVLFGIDQASETCR